MIHAFKYREPYDFLNRARQSAEAMLRDVYVSTIGRAPPANERLTIETAVRDHKVAHALGRKIVKHSRVIQDLGNQGSHAGERAPEDWTDADLVDAQTALRAVTEWYYDEFRGEAVPELVRVLSYRGRPSAPWSLDERRIYDQEFLGNLYRIQSILGEGASAVVYLATNTIRRKSFALKVSKPHEDDAVRLERFRREAARAIELRHPNILPVHEVNVLDDGRLYLVMSHAPGGTIRVRADARRPEMSEVSRWAEQLLDALAHIHAQGIVHRDIKPSNVLLGENGDVLLSDFGIATERSDRTQLTRSGEILGTAGYMAPECQHPPFEASPKSDVYAAAKLLTELVTGSAVVPGKNVPAPLGPCLRKMGEQDPEDRPSADEALRLLKGDPQAPARRAPRASETGTPSPRSGGRIAPAKADNAPAEEPPIPPTVVRTGSDYLAQLPRPLVERAPIPPTPPRRTGGTESAGQSVLRAASHEPPTEIPSPVSDDVLEAFLSDWKPPLHASVASLLNSLAQNPEQAEQLSRDLDWLLADGSVQRERVSESVIQAAFETLSQAIKARPESAPLRAARAALVEMLDRHGDYRANRNRLELALGDMSKASAASKGNAGWYERRARIGAALSMLSSGEERRRLRSEILRDRRNAFVCGAGDHRLLNRIIVEEAKAAQTDSAGLFATGMLMRGETLEWGELAAIDESQTWVELCHVLGILIEGRFADAASRMKRANVQDAAWCAALGLALAGDASAQENQVLGRVLGRAGPRADEATAWFQKALGEHEKGDLEPWPWWEEAVRSQMASLRDAARR